MIPSFLSLMCLQPTQLRQYAVKKLDRQFSTLDSLLSTREVRAIRKFINMPYLIRFYDIIRDDSTDSAFLVMERMDLDLLTYILQVKKNEQIDINIQPQPQPQRHQNHHNLQISPDQPHQHYGTTTGPFIGNNNTDHRLPRRGIDSVNFKSILWQTLQGVKAIHDSNWVHRDIKPENLLLQYKPRRRPNNDDGPLFNVKVADFSLARSVPDTSANGEDRRMTGYIASRWYRAPELLLQNSYGQPVDCWAVGVVACEMITLDAIFQGRDDQGQLNIITDVLLGYSSSPPGNGDGRTLSCILNTDADTQRFIESLVQFDQSKRFSAEQALNDDFFNVPIERSSHFDLSLAAFELTPPPQSSKNHPLHSLQQKSNQNSQRIAHPPAGVTPDPSQHQRHRNPRQHKHRKRSHHYDPNISPNQETTMQISAPRRRREDNDPAQILFEAAFLED